MAITIKKPLFNQILFIICVVVPFFNVYELSFIVWLTAILLSIKNNYSVEFIKYWILFLAIFLISLIVGLFFNHQIYFIIRDNTYLLKPICGLLLGYQLFNKNIKNPFQFIVYAGVAIASYHLLMVLYGILILGNRTVINIRATAGYFNDFEVYALIFLIFHKKLGLNFSSKQNKIFIIIIGLSSFFYLARTNFIQFIVLFIALKGFFIWNKKAVIIVLTTIIFTLLGYAAVYYYNPVRNGKGLDEFLYKIKMVPAEAFSTKINRDDWKQFNDNYRSYENIRTVQQLTYQDHLWFGEGMGSKVDLKQKIFLGDMQLRYISILHNGYMTVLLKSGLLGLFVYLLTILKFFKNKNTLIHELNNINLIFIGTGVFLIISNWVFMGFYNPVDTKSILIGFLFAYKNEIQKFNNFEKCRL